MEAQALRNPSRRRGRPASELKSALTLLSTLLATSLLPVPAGALQSAGVDASASVAETEMPASAAATSAVKLPLEKVRVLALDAEKRAVIRLPDSPPRVVEPGDEIPEAGALILAVGIDKLVVEILGGEDEPTRLKAWVFKSADAGSPSRVLRLNPAAPVQQPRRLTVFATPEVAPAETGEADAAEPQPNDTRSEASDPAEGGE